MTFFDEAKKIRACKIIYLAAVLEAFLHIFSNFGNPHIYLRYLVPGRIVHYT